MGDHWNLPHNPVDLEQREGRVHRYKGHAVRKNVAERYGLGGIRTDSRPGPDPWKILFQRARDDRATDSNDLIPYWIFEEGSARVQRRVPLLPFSREVDQLRRLVGSLAVYRLAFGQPRQQDLVEYLRRRHEDTDELDLDQFQDFVGAAGSDQMTTRHYIESCELYDSALLLFVPSNLTALLTPSSQLKLNLRI